MSLYQAVEKIENAANSSIGKENEDYIGVDDLLYCGKCHTPKQVVINLCGQIKKPNCLCKCGVEKRDRFELSRMDEKKRRRIEEFRRIGIPGKELRKCTFEADDGYNPELTKIALNYVDNFQEMMSAGKGILFYGDVGTGKTFTAAAIANALIDKGYKCFVTNFSTIINTLSGMFDKQEYIDRLNSYALLIIDDLAAERSTAYGNEIVHSIIDNRCNVGLPMIVTTNLTAEELKCPRTKENKRIYSRLLDKCFPVAMNGKDRRKQKFVEEYDYYHEILTFEEL